MKNQPHNYSNKLRSACPKLFKLRMCTHHTGTLKKSPYNPALKSTGEQIFGQSKTCMGFPMFPTTMHYTVEKFPPSTHFMLFRKLSNLGLKYILNKSCLRLHW